MTVRSADDLRAKIREIPDFPKPGILFYDITTLLKDREAFSDVIDRMAEAVQGDQIDLVVGMESRGFIFAAPLAYKLGAGFVPVRKLGKLPADTIEVEYDLEQLLGDRGLLPLFGIPEHLPDALQQLGVRHAGGRRVSHSGS